MHVEPELLPALYESLQRTGGRFMRALQKALLNCDTGHHLALALIEMRGASDADNCRKLMETFPDLWAVYGMSEDHRRQLLLDAWADDLAPYVERAKAIKTMREA